MTYYTATEIPTKTTGEKVQCAIDLSFRLRSGATLGGTPTVTPSSANLVASSPTVTSAAWVINGSSVASGEAITFFTSGGTAGETYDITITTTTSDGQVFTERVRMRVVS